MQEPRVESRAVRAHLHIQGRVQCVGYRAATQDRALALHVSGWVRNLEDGRVEVLAEGPMEKLEALIAWCWKGPVFAQVTDVRVDWEQPRGGLLGFEMRR